MKEKDKKAVEEAGDKALAAAKILNKADVPYIIIIGAPDEDGPYEGILGVRGDSVDICGMIAVVTNTTTKTQGRCTDLKKETCMTNDVLLLAEQTRDVLQTLLGGVAVDNRGIVTLRDGSNFEEPKALIEKLYEVACDYWGEHSTDKSNHPGEKLRELVGIVLTGHEAFDIVGWKTEIKKQTEGWAKKGGAIKSDTRWN